MLLLLPRRSPCCPCLPACRLAALLLPCCCPSVAVLACGPTPHSHPAPSHPALDRIPITTHRMRRGPKGPLALRHPQHRCATTNMHGALPAPRLARLACARPSGGRRDGADPGRRGDAVWYHPPRRPTPPRLGRRWQRGRQQAERVRSAHGECRITAWCSRAWCSRASTFAQRLAQ